MGGCCGTRHCDASGMDWNLAPLRSIQTSISGALAVQNSLTQSSILTSSFQAHGSPNSEIHHPVARLGIKINDTPTFSRSKIMSVSSFHLSCLQSINGTDKPNLNALETLACYTIYGHLMGPFNPSAPSRARQAFLWALHKLDRSFIPPTMATVTWKMHFGLIPIPYTASRR